VSDLISGAVGEVGGAGPATLRSAASALSGTLLATVNNNVTTTLTTGDIHVSADLPSSVAPSIVTELRRESRALSRQVRDAFDDQDARANLGF
jgi:hypothetical protein